MGLGLVLAGLCAGEGTLLADPGGVHALEGQLALLAPDLAATAETLRSLVLSNLAGLAPSVASAISVRSAYHHDTLTTAVTNYYISSV